MSNCDLNYHDEVVTRWATALRIVIPIILVIGLGVVSHAQKAELKQANSPVMQIIDKSSLTEGQIVEETVRLSSTK